MIECDDSVDNFTGEYIKCIYTTIDINIDHELTHNMLIIYLLLCRTCLNIDIPPTAVWICSSCI